MKDVSRIKLFEAEHFIEDAEARAAHDDTYSPSVAIGHANDAIILALDALCHERGVDTPRRHDDGQSVYLLMLRRGQVPETGAHWRPFLGRANAQRTAFQYHGELTSKSEARKFVRDAAGFVAFIRSLLGN